MKMIQRTVGGIVVAVTAMSLAAVPGSQAATHHHRRALPNLTVSGGSIRLSGGRIAGSFTVRNAGRARAGRSQAELSLTVGRKHPRLGTFSVHVLKVGARSKVVASVRAPSGMPAGSYPMLACADSTRKVSESSERDNCARVGQLRLSSPSGPPGATTTSPAAPPPSTPPPGIATPFTPTQPRPGPAQVPSAPITVEPDNPTLVNDSFAGLTGSYFVTTPPKYDATGQTPMRLLVWMHGCGGDAQGDSFEMIASNQKPKGEANDNRDFIVISIGGTDGGCWNPDTDVVKVLMAIADVTTHFNIDRRHIFIAGYSSGGDLAYRTIFYNADEFAGILAVNTNPFRDTGSTEAQSMAAASRKFNIAQVAHKEDTEYHPDACTDCLEGGGNDPGVSPAISDLQSAGYKVEYFIKPGTHSDEDDFKAHTGTDFDFRQFALPFIDDPAWASPGS
jgi:predicted esterase